MIMKKEFTEDEKNRIWVHYMVTQVFLRHSRLVFTMNDKKPEDRVGQEVTIYKHFGIFTTRSNHKGIVRDFDSFCNDDNDLRSDSLRGWYFRFKNEIFGKDYKKN